MQHVGDLRNPRIGLDGRYVSLSPAPAMTARAERRAMIALVAVFVLLVQALIPAMASAAPGPGGAVICTQMGLQTAPDDGGIAAEHACKHCLCPAPVSDPPPAISIQRIAYAARATPVTPKSLRLTPPTRAPPRPPGQGPPAQTA